MRIARQLVNSVLVATWLLTAPVVAQQSIDTVYPTLGRTGEPLDISIQGTGFANDSRLTLSLDAGNTNFIVNTITEFESVWDVKVIQDIGYYTTSDKLHIVNLSDPDSPVEIGSVGLLPPNNFSRKIEIANDTAYVLSDDGLQTIDISDPVRPTRQGLLEITEGDGRDLSVVDDRVYLATRGGEAPGLIIVDVGDSTAPAIVTELAVNDGFNDGAFSIAVKDNFAFVGTPGAFKVFDVSDDANPVLVSDSLRLLNFKDDIEIVDDIAYMTNRDDGLRIIDISDPIFPILISSVDTQSEAQAVSVFGDFAYIGDGNAGLFIVDISDPKNPLPVGSVNTPGAALGAAKVGNFLLLATGGGLVGGLQLIDITRPPSFSYLGREETDDDAQDLKIVNDIAYIAAANEVLHIIDVSDPRNPTTLGSWDDPFSGGDVVDVQGSLAVVGGYYQFDTGIQLFDVADPANPEQLGQLVIEGLLNLAEIKIQGDIAYVLVDTELILVDIGNRLSPAILGSVDLGIRARHMTLDGNVATVVGNFGIAFVDIGDPETPAIDRIIETEGTGSGLVVEDMAYLFQNLTQRLEIVDISNPGSPAVLGSIQLPTQIRKMEVQGDRLYATTISEGIFVIDVSDPANLLQFASLNTVATVQNIVLGDGLVYVADGKAGLVILPTPIEIEDYTVVNSEVVTASLPAIADEGNYTLKVFNSDTSAELAGAVTFSNTALIFSQPDDDTADPDVPEPTPESVSKAIIVAGGGPYAGNNLWPATQLATRQAYRALAYQGYLRENIYLLSPEDEDVDRDGELNDVDADATTANLEDAILNWAMNEGAPAHELLLYIVDHGGDSQFRINQTEQLSAIQLDDWLDELQLELPGKILVIYDACQSGTFVPILTPPSGKERIVMTSSGDEDAHFLNQGGLSFSFQFWSSIFSGGNLYDSYVFGKRMMLNYQSARIDTNGNGIPDEKSDVTEAQELVVGRGAVPASDKPFISAVSPPQVIQGTAAASITASGIIDSTGISRVWGVISHPGFDTGAKDVPVLDAPEIELTDPDGDNLWVGSYDGFELQGLYSITIYAQNSNGFYSIPDDDDRNVTTVQQLNDNSDTDGDGVVDGLDAFPTDSTESIDTDGDGIGNNADTDDDNDLVLDVNDDFPLDSSRVTSSDTSQNIQESSFTTSSGELYLPLVEVNLPGEPSSRYSPVVLERALDCEGVAFRVTGATLASDATTNDGNLALSTFDGETAQLTIPLLEVIIPGFFGDTLTFEYADVIMVLDESCPGPGLIVVSATPLQ